MRLAERIKIVPGNIFLCVELPDDVKTRLQPRADVFGPAAAVVDHVTLIFVPKKSEPIPPATIDAALAAAERVSQRHAPIDARFGGWAYFDGASRDGEPKTALVAVVDAPGLAELYADLAQELEAATGIRPSNEHGFNPHVTFAYLDKGERVDELPVLDDGFTIDEITTASDDIVKLPLTGNVHESLVRQYVYRALVERRVKKKAVGRPLYKTSRSRKDWWVQAKSSRKIDSYLRSLGMKR